jgi:hypothetical protein
MDGLKPGKPANVRKFSTQNYTCNFFTGINIVVKNILEKRAAKGGPL